MGDAECVPPAALSPATTHLASQAADSDTNWHSQVTTAAVFATGCLLSTYGDVTGGLTDFADTLARPQKSRTRTVTWSPGPRGCGTQCQTVCWILRLSIFGLEVAHNRACESQGSSAQARLLFATVVGPKWQRQRVGSSASAASVSCVSGLDWLAQWRALTSNERHAPTTSDDAQPVGTLGLLTRRRQRKRERACVNCNEAKRIPSHGSIGLPVTEWATAHLRVEFIRSVGPEHGSI